MLVIGIFYFSHSVFIWLLSQGCLNLKSCAKMLNFDKFENLQFGVGLTNTGCMSISVLYAHTELEQSGMQKMILTDIDNTSKQEGDFKRLNTLAHYQVKHCLTLSQTSPGFTCLHYKS